MAVNLTHEDFKWLWDDFSPGPVHKDTSAWSAKLNYAMRRDITKKLCLRLQCLVNRPTLKFTKIAVTGALHHSPRDGLTELEFTFSDGTRLTQWGEDIFGPRQELIAGQLSWADLVFHEHLYAAAQMPNGKALAWQRLEEKGLGATLCERGLWPGVADTAVAQIQTLMRDSADHVGIAAYWYLCQWFCRRLREALPLKTGHKHTIQTVDVVARVSDKEVPIRCIFQFTGVMRGPAKQPMQGQISLTHILKPAELRMYTTDEAQSQVALVHLKQLVLEAEQANVSARPFDNGDDTEMDEEDDEAKAPAPAPAPAEAKYDDDEDDASPRSRSPTKRARTARGAVATATDFEASRSRARVTPARHRKAPKVQEEIIELSDDDEEDEDNKDA
jgi:hypothetical protein